MATSTSRTVAAVTLVLSLAAGVIALQPVNQPAPQPAAQPPQPAPVEPKEGESPTRRGETMSVGRAMKVIAQSIEQLRAQIDDPAKKNDNLRLVNEMQRAAVIAKGQPVPSGVLENFANEAAKTKVSVAIRKDLITLVRKLLDVETEIAEGKIDAAKAHLDEVMKLGDEAHSRLSGEP